MKLIVAGTRTLNPSSRVIADGLKQIGFDDSRDIVLQGGAKGVDLAAVAYCENMGIECIQYDADWNNLVVPDAVIKTNSYGKRYNAKAGHDRNALMAQDADALLLIWTGDKMKSPGSFNMKTQMIAMNKPFHEIIIKD